MLLPEWNSLLVLELCFDTCNSVRWHFIILYGFSVTSLDKNLHLLSEFKDKSGFFLDSVILKCLIIFKIFVSIIKLLLSTDYAFLCKNLSFDISYSIAWNNFELYSFTSLCLNINSHDLANFEDEGWFILDSVARKLFLVLKPLSSEEKMLLFLRNAFFVLNVRFYPSYRIRWYYFKLDGLTCISLDKNCHGLSKSENKSRFWLDFILSKREGIFKILSSEVELLLSTQNTSFFKNHRFYVSYCVSW